MFSIFKIYGKITNEEAAEGTIKASMVIIMAIIMEANMAILRWVKIGTIVVYLEI